MILLGSTGSIGVNTLKIAKKFNISVDVLVAGKNISLLNQQIQEFKPQTVVISDKNDITKINSQNIENLKILHGEENILTAIEESKSDLVVNALVGFLGLKPTLKTLELNKKLALANKESLVVAGAFLDSSKIIPIDSEHFGLWYLVKNQQQKNISKMVITASGGAFRDWEIESMRSATPKDALKHPNWSMGNKITIDSATMVNKMFELLEAKWLFDIQEPHRLDAIIEPKSVIHAVVDFIDGSSTAHIANTDMQLPISFAVSKNQEVNTQILKPIDLLKIKNLEFREIKSDKYPIWELKNEILKNPKLGAIFNSANDIAVANFLSNKIKFFDIHKTIISVFDKFANQLPNNLDDIFILNQEINIFLK
jgi:1-deoxy-D-xylulose-5-phosphate reductoisomerase